MRAPIIRVRRAPPVATAPALESISYYVFGHSLYTWDGGPSVEPASTAESSTGYWLGALSNDNSKTSGGAGQFGQLAGHAIPPVKGITYSTDAFDPWPSGNFGDQDFTHTIIMPSNFEQNTSTPAQYMPDTRRVVDYIRDNKADADLTIYAHWVKPEDVLTPVDPANLTSAEWLTVRNWQRGFYTDWFTGWQDLIVAEYPTLNVRMIPVGNIIADLVDNVAAMSSIAYSSLYVDTGPHGTRSTYFLAALIMYRALYGANPSSSYTPPAGMIASEIANNLSDIINYIDTRLTHYNNTGFNVYV